MRKPDPPVRYSIRGKALRNRHEPREKIPARPQRGTGYRTLPSPAVEDPFSVGSAAAEPAAPAEVSSRELPAANAGASPAVPRAARNPVRRSRRFWLLQAGLLCLLAVLGLLLYRGRKNATLTVTWLVPGRPELTEEQTVLYGESVALRPAVSVPGQTFLCWEDSRGRTEARETFPLYFSRTLTARFLPAFETEAHITYLDTGENGLLNPGGSVSMRDLVLAFYRLLNTDSSGSGRFTDVPEEDPCYEAAAYLKDIGVLTGKRLHPDERVTNGEFLKLLCAFYPQREGAFLFQDLDAGSPLYPCYCTAAANGWITSGSLVRARTDEPLTRGEFTRIMNRVLHRDGVRHLLPEQTGTMLDVVPGGEYYDDLVEAAIPHEYRMEGQEEIWTDSEPLPVHEPGFFFSGVRLHCIAEDGSPVVGDAQGGLMFNLNGEITTGDPALDARLWEILENTISPESMTREEMLRAVYDYVVQNFSYIYGHMYAFGAGGWAEKEAWRMLTDHGGNCYCYAALFYELARFVGYDAVLYSGRVSGEQYDFRDYDGNVVYAGERSTPHAWVEIEIDGELYLFDAEYEYRSYGLNKMFKRDNTVWLQFGYARPDTPA